MIPAGYPVHVPKGTGTQLMAGLEMIPPEHRDSWRMHRLGTGETVADVGKRYGIAVNSLVAANNLQSREASEGDRLIIPAVLRADPVVAKRPVKQAPTARRTTASTTKAKAPAAQPKTGTKPKPKPVSKPAAIVAQTKKQ
jgi:membrane-bound lytic murein transglycosylase D